MSAYCARTDITNGLPSGHGISNDNLDVIITEASAWVDSGLCVRYWHFPAATATPATPSVVKQITRLYGQWVAWTQYLLASSRMMPEGVAQLRVEAEDLIAKLTAQPPLYQIPTETITEALSFAPGDLNDDEHLFGCSPYDIIPLSVRVDGYEWGVDFRAYRRDKVRGWIFQSLNSAITDDAETGDSVTYEYSYTRRREQDLPPSVDTVVVRRA